MASTFRDHIGSGGAVGSTGISVAVGATVGVGAGLTVGVAVATASGGAVVAATAGGAGEAISATLPDTEVPPPAAATAAAHMEATDFVTAIRHSDLN